MRASAREGKYRRGSTRTDDIELESDDRQLASDPSNRRAGDLKTRISRNFVLRMAPVATVMAAAAFECSDGRVQEAAAFDAKEAMRQDYDKFSSKYDELDGGAAQIWPLRKACATPRQARRQGGRGRASVLEQSAPVTLFEGGGDDAAAPAHGLPSG